MARSGPVGGQNTVLVILISAARNLRVAQAVTA